VLVCLIATASACCWPGCCCRCFPTWSAQAGPACSRRQHRWALALLLGVLVGVLAGAYPTWSALKVRPTAALAGRGNAETAGGLWLRRVLTVLQFATAMHSSARTGST
jgi:hypothetical protein